MTVTACDMITIKCYVMLTCKIFLIVGNDFHEVNTAIEKLDLRENLFQVIENNSLCSLLTTSHLVYLDLSYCGLEGNRFFFIAI